MVNHKYYNGDERYFLYVDVDSEKILGNVSKKDLDFAIEEYISKYYKKIVTPLLNQVGMDGKKKYKPETAIKEIKSKIYKNFSK